MNHKEKQEEIEYTLGLLASIHKKYGLSEQQEKQVFRLKEKAKEHKEEVEKGCGKEFYRKSLGSEVKCGLDYGNKRFHYCKSCQEVLDKYNKMEI